MKNTLFLLGLLLFISCEDPIDVSLPEVVDNIVIDAMLWRPVGETTGTLEVVLSKTTDFYSVEVPYVSGAEITLQHGDVAQIAQEETPGHYQLADVAVTANTTYTLHVLVDGIRYTATASLALSTRIDAITQGENTLLSGDAVEAIISFTDRPEEGNYYLTDFGYNNLIVTRDEFYNGNQVHFSFFYDEYFPKNTPTPVHLMGVDKNFYTYMQILISHAGQDGGGPFATAKSTLRGNIENTANPSAFPMGYFRVIERDTFIFTATEN